MPLPIIRKASVFCFSLIALSFACAAFAQQKETPGSAVTAIEVRGNKSVSENTIISKLKTRIGGIYQENVASDDLKRLYLTGYFSDVKIDTEPYKDGIKLVIMVKERPVIDKVSFSGSRRSISDAKLKETIKSKEGQYLDFPTLEEDARALKGAFEKKGYGRVKAEYKTAVDDKTNKAKVEFILSEGKRQYIQRIYVEGNLSFSDGRILKLIKTKRAWLFGSGVLKEDVLADDLERVKSFYQNNGFIDAEVSQETKLDPSNRLIFITLTIKEGKKYSVGQTHIRGNVDIPERDITPRVKEMLPGKVFSPEALKRDTSNIQGVYFDRGYISAAVTATTSLNAETGLVDIGFSIVENQISYVNLVKITGNVKTKDKVIRRELRIRPGQRFDGEKLRRSKERLQNLGFFEEVSYDIEDTEVPDKKNLVVDVKETKTGMFSFGGGYSTVDKLVGFVEIEQKNFDWKNWPTFTGAGQDLKLRTSLGSQSSSNELSFTEPWLYDYPVSFGFDVYKRQHKRESDTGYGYDEDVTGGDLRLGKEFSEYLRGDFTYRYDRIKIGNINETASQDLKDEEGTNAISSTEYALTFDDRDNVFNPLRGNVLSGSMQVAGGPFSGDKDFWKFFGRASHFFPCWHNSVLEARARVGIAKPFSDTVKIPIYERFFAGGAYTIRGYRERKVGPVDPLSGDPLGGDALLVGNLEYTYPVLDFLRLAAFFDAGNVWEKAGDLGTSGIKSAYGVGFRLKTPIGPVMLDYGIPLDKESGEETKGKGRFHFSMSHGF